jgi:hypothetical protein
MELANETITLNGNTEIIVAKLPYLELTNLENDPEPVTLPNPNHYDLRIAGELTPGGKPLWYQHLPYKVKFSPGRSTDVLLIQWWAVPGLEQQYQQLKKDTDMAVRLKAITEILQGVNPQPPQPDVPIPEQYLRDIEITPPDKKIETKANALRLSDSQIPELLVTDEDPDLCGSSGCPRSIYGLRREVNGDGKISLKYKPLLEGGWKGSFYALDNVTNGYKDLLFNGNGGTSILKFDGVSYQEVECFSHEYKNLDDIQPTDCQQPVYALTSGRKLHDEDAEDAQATHKSAAVNPAIPEDAYTTDLYTKRPNSAVCCDTYLVIPDTPIKLRATGSVDTIVRQGFVTINLRLRMKLSEAKSGFWEYREAANEPLSFVCSVDNPNCAKVLDDLRRFRGPSGNWVVQHGASKRCENWTLTALYSVPPDYKHIRPGVDNTPAPIPLTIPALLTRYPSSGGAPCVNGVDTQQQ